MSIVLARIDNRLIHGQVVQGWLPSMDIDDVIVVSDQASSSTLMSKMLRMSLPSGYALHIFNSADAAVHLSKQDTLKTFVLIEDFESLAALIAAGVGFETVNVGNTKFECGKKEYGQGVYLGENDLVLIKDLISKKIKFDVRALPSSLSKRLL